MREQTEGGKQWNAQSLPQHAQASALLPQWKQQGRRLVTTKYVLVELTSPFTSPLGVPRPTQFRYIDAIKTAPYVEIVHCGLCPGCSRLGLAEVKT